jgi:hypothetical protein
MAARGPRQKAKTSFGRPDMMRREGIERRRNRRVEEPLTAQEKISQTQNAQDHLEDARTARGIGRALGRHKLLRAFAPENTGTEQIWATVASTFIFWTVIPFYFFQVIMWVIGLTGIAVETIPLISEASPGTELYILSYAVIALIGIGSMAYAALVYSMRGVRCFAGVRALMFAVCLAGYLVFFINLFPWVLLWMASVILAKVEDEEED